MNNRRYYILTGLDNQAWLRVPYYELNALKLLERISDKSYFDNEHGYLYNKTDMKLYLECQKMDINNFIKYQTIERKSDVLDLFEIFSKGLSHYLSFLYKHSLEYQFEIEE